MNSSTECRDRSRLDVAIGNCSESIAMLHGMIGTLEGRLQSVLESSPEQARPIQGGVEGLRAPSVSPLLVLERVDKLNDDVIQANKRLDAIMNRLHV